jgi:hypothetical protein
MTAEFDEELHEKVKHLSDREIAEQYPPERVEKLLKEANLNA